MLRSILLNRIELKVVHQLQYQVLPKHRKLNNTKQNITKKKKKKETYKRTQKIQTFIDLGRLYSIEMR